MMDIGNYSKNLNLLHRLFMMLYYIFENITLLAEAKMISLRVQTYCELLMSTSFLLGNSFHLIYYLTVLAKTTRHIKAIKAELLIQQKPVFYSKLQKIENVNWYIKLSILRKFGDLIMAMNDLHLFNSVFDDKVAKLAVGVTGFLSSGISIYQIFNRVDYFK